MNYYELMIIGTGGKGVLLIGRLLAEAGIQQFEHTLFFPNYAPAMRGGESECTIVLSNDSINSPAKFEPLAVIAMTSSALMSIENRIKPEGIIILDSTVIPEKIKRNDLSTFYIPASQKALELGGHQAANMVLLGAYLEYSNAIPLDMVEKALDNKLQEESKNSILSLNKRALNEGANLIANYKG